MEDFLFESIRVVLGALLEVFFELMGEAVIDLVARSIMKVFVAESPIRPAVATIGYLFLGLGSGTLSLIILPHPVFHPSRIHGISLVISPVLTGMIMSYVGLLSSRKGRQRIQIESFGYGFTFAFGMSLVRFLFLK
jgi:hypothetical protein